MLNLWLHPCAPRTPQGSTPWPYALTAALPATSWAADLATIMLADGSLLGHLVSSSNHDSISPFRHPEARLLPVTALTKVAVARDLCIGFPATTVSTLAPVLDMS
ncbi:hypothetical protein Pcinc_002139 [Petrolisthes cinctipes]|uniref:Uncharacterized protein n=1 Tax=Petrolisthes cinctipes TaxID=88211 RepID=A0AAE1GLL6_PETCI|nr:hypothetical protein Pcinc_002139 [Petrolisthes cinctipes]